MGSVQAVISDFGGVLTSPLVDSFVAYEDASGISPRAFGGAIAAVTESDGANPLFELETGRMTEVEFLAKLARELTGQLGREVTLHGFSDAYFGHLRPNGRMIDFMRALKERGYRMAICTNNVREWELVWRAMLPVDEIFDVVVDSAFVGCRKPEPAIYEETLRRLGVPADASVFIDDIDINCHAATELGMRSIWFRSTEQAIAEIEAQLG